MHARAERRSWAIPTFFVAAILFVAVTLLHRWGVLRTMDATLTEAIRAIPSEPLAQLAAIYDVVFDAAPIFVAAAILAIGLARFGPPWSWVAPIFITLSSLLDLALRRGVSVLLRPQELLTIAIRELSGRDPGLGPYPSGHVERTLFLAIIVLAYLPRRFAVPALVVAATTPFVRVYGGAHVVSDAVGGAALGVAVGAFAVCVTDMLSGAVAKTRARRSREQS